MNSDFPHQSLAAAWQQFFMTQWHAGSALLAMACPSMMDQDGKPPLRRLTNLHNDSIPVFDQCNMQEALCASG